MSSLKSAMVGVFAPRELANTTNQGPLSLPSELAVKHLPGHPCMKGNPVRGLGWCKDVTSSWDWRFTERLVPLRGLDGSGGGQEMAGERQGPGPAGACGPG